MIEFLRKLLGGLFRQPTPEIKRPPAVVETTIGTNGPLKRPVLIAHEDTRITMVLDYNFEDVLAWAEYDCEANKFSLVQKGGAVADLYDVVANDDKEKFRNFNRLFIVTSFNDIRIMHNLSLIVR
ncbi:MAG TPA: hypothetical protein EYQ41_11810 [Micavibrio sp.]|nr:hypothetical protein [Micavibrio sp.]